MAKFNYDNDPDPQCIASAFGVAEGLTNEIMFMNDEYRRWPGEGQEEKRWHAVRDWVVRNIKQEGVN